MNKKAGTSKADLFCGVRSIVIATLTVFFAVAAGPALGSTRGDGNEPRKKTATAADAGKPAAGDKTSSDSNSADAKTATGATSDASATTPSADEQLLQLNEKLRKLEELVQQQQRMIDAIQGTQKAASVTADGHSTAVSAAPSEAAAKSATPAGSTTAAASGSTAAASAAQGDESPLQFRIGTTTIMPVGFMDFTGVFRSTTTGAGIGTNFGSIPFTNGVTGKLTEFRFSAQNSRLGLRADTDVKGAHVMGYYESDFLGFVPVNAPVSTNSYTFRLRLFWLDIRKDKWEILGGQSWSLLTPNRKGLSPLPDDVFFSRNVDANYQLGITWARQAQFRFVYHPSETATLGLSLEAPEQYIGGSGGGGTITFPTAFVNSYAAQLDSGGTTLNVPNLHPDIIAKVAFDPKVSDHNLHIEFGGIVRSFRVYNPLTNQKLTSTGGGGTYGLNLELVKNFRFVSNGFISDGGGRYIFGNAPDLIIRGDGSPSLVHSASIVAGFEANLSSKFLLYGYYGGVYIQRNIAIDPANGKPVGYGFTGSPNSNNRNIQEGTLGYTYTFWRDAKYGAVQFMTQYSYLTRNPWAVAAGQPGTTHAHIVFINLRYLLPGAPPKVAAPGK